MKALFVTYLNARISDCFFSCSEFPNANFFTLSWSLVGGVDICLSDNWMISEEGRFSTDERCYYFYMNEAICIAPILPDAFPLDEMLSNRDSW